MNLPIAMFTVVLPSVLFSLALAGIILGALRALRALRALGVVKPEAKQPQDCEDTRMVQELHRGMSALEDRAESLETILLQTSGKEC
jgi:hypothetical protein